MTATGPQGEPERTMVRAAHFSVRVHAARAPHDTALGRLYHPAVPSGSDSERLTGEVPPDRSLAPLPVVILLPAVNVCCDTYRWLAVELVRAGFATVTYDHVGELMPGHIGLSPGIDLDALTPESFATRPSATAVGPILAALDTMNSSGALEAMLDLSHIAFGGHSAGGTVALENADPVFFGGVGAVFSYGSHTVPVQALGHAPDAVLPVGPVPCMLVAGEVDGVISASADRYGATPGAVDHSPVARTFDHGVGPGATAYEIVLRGCNHLLVCDPADPTSARGFLEEPPESDPVSARALFVELVVAFLRRHLLDIPGEGPAALAERSDLVVSLRSRGPGAG